MLQKIYKLPIAQITIIVFCLGLFGLIFKEYNYKYSDRVIRIEVISKNWIETNNPYGYRPPFWLSNTNLIGFEEKDVTGKTIAKVVDEDNYERGSEEAEIYLDIKLQTNYDKKTNQYIYKNKPVSLGSKIELYLNDTYVVGQIIDTDITPEDKFKIYKKIRIYSVQPDFKLTKDTSPVISMNRSKNQKIAILKTISATERQQSNLSIQNNKVVLINNSPIKEYELFYEVFLECQIKDEKIYFGEHQNVKVGANIYFHSDKFTNIGGVITDISDSTYDEFEKAAVSK